MGESGETRKSFDKNSFPQQTDVLNIVMDYITQGMVVVGPDYRTLAFNRHFEEMFQLPSGTIEVGADFREILEMWADRTGQDQQMLDCAKSQLDEPSPFEFEFSQLINGIPRWCLLTHNPLPGKGFVRTFTDITARKRDEDALRLAKAAAEEANQAKDVFLGMVSHEMRTPLAIIAGVGEILVKRLGTRERDELLPLLQQSTSLLRRHIDDLIDLARIEAGSISLKPSLFSLSEVLNEILAAALPRITAKGLNFRSEYDDDQPDKIIGDRQRITQILTNLIENAVKATTEGYITTRKTRKGDCILISVTDTGCGIIPEQMTAVFEPFVTMSPSGGIGLGLAISRRLAEAMGGSLTVESTPSHGCCFSLALPHQESEEIYDCKVHFVPEPAPIKESIHLLAVDDLPENLVLLRLLLAETPIVMSAAGNGSEALELLAQQHFDVLLTDMRMPGIDGITLVRMIRADEKENGRRRLRIISLSANAYPEDIHKAMEAGCDSCLSRPFDTNHLLLEMAVAVPDNNGKQKDDEQEARPGIEQQFDRLREAAKERIAASVAAIEEALKRGDNATIREEGHRIKGLGMSLTMPDAERAGTGLEKAGRDEKLDEVPEILKKLRP